MVGRATFLVFMAFAFVPSLATVYDVGGSGGWDLDVNYTTWASTESLFVGDELQFVDGRFFEITAFRRRFQDDE
ncbi:hypothetical protein AMTR_s00002p00201760 [Amborella trichopoda]|uniref:Phytocyanin domain-containing protein n=1 Tax=Amborella trichopoda TaxID=13333 RepID=W1P2D2_AMBTC|nr:hypothetical protein AMTR_s00002p00201760 [Amborella trichopoda]